MKEQLNALIAAAWEEYNEIHEAEVADDYSDAMVSMDRKYAEGFAEGLERAYGLMFGEKNE